MQNSSGTASSRQLASTPTSERIFSSSSPSCGGGRGGGEPPPFPRFNLPDSYWTQDRAQSNAERLFAQTGVSDFIARSQAQSCQWQDALLKAIEDQQEDKENDPRSRTLSPVVVQPFRPIQFPDLELPPDIFVGLVLLKDPDTAEPAPQSSTSSTSSAPVASTQHNAASGGCCVPPGCNIL